MRERVLLTGASGFVGAHALRHLLSETDWDIVCPVTWSHQGMPERVTSALAGHDARRVTVLTHDLRAVPYEHSPLLRQLGHIDYVWNIAAESHVDRSITEPVDFVKANVDLALAMGELVRRLEPEMVLQMSTDEVYGPALPDQFHAEWESIRPSNPYSASKACQEAILYSYWRTYGIPLVLTNTMNIVGEMQAPEKYMPKVLRSVLNGDVLRVHADLSDPTAPVIGSRCWLHARNLADAWLWITTSDPVLPHADGYSDPLRLNIVGEERSNLEIAEMVRSAASLATGRELGLHHVLEDFHSTRPGHDLRYALDGTKIDLLGWKAPMSLDEGVEHLVRWTIAHPEWLA